MRPHVIALFALVPALTGLGVHYSEARARRDEPAPAIVHGRVAKQDVAEIHVDGIEGPTEPGWRGYLRKGGDVVFTWSSGKQETVLDGAGKPCVLGCVSLYVSAMSANQSAFQKAPDTTAKDPDTLGDGWVSDAAACARACDPGTAMSWPQGGVK